MKKVVVISALFILILVAGYYPVTAKVAREPFSVTLPLQVLGCDREWVSGTIIHQRDCAYSSLGPITVAGVEVEISGVANFNLNSQTFNGSDFGTVILTATDGSGTWEGTFAGTATSGLLSNQFVAQGTGDLAGSIVNGSYVEFAPLTGTFSGEVMVVPAK